VGDYRGHKGSGTWHPQFLRLEALTRIKHGLAHPGFSTASGMNRKLIGRFRLIFRLEYTRRSADAVKPARRI